MRTAIVRLSPAFCRGLIPYTITSVMVVALMTRPAALIRCGNTSQKTTSPSNQDNGSRSHSAPKEYPRPTAAVTTKPLLAVAPALSPTSHRFRRCSDNVADATRFASRLPRIATTKVPSRAIAKTMIEMSTPFLGPVQECCFDAGIDREKSGKMQRAPGTSSGLTQDHWCARSRGIGPHRSASVPEFHERAGAGQSGLGRLLRPILLGTFRVAASGSCESSWFKRKD